MSRATFVPVAWFVPAVVAFYCGAALTISLLSFGRFLFRREPFAFWVGLGFWTSSLFSLAHILCLEGSPLVLDSDAAYLFYLSYLALLIPAFCPLARAKAPTLSSWRALFRRLAWVSLGCAIVAGAIFLSANRLPALSLVPAPFPARFFHYGFLLLYSAGALAQWRRYRRTEDPLAGYVFAFLLLGLWVFAALALSRRPYDLLWTSSWLYPLAGYSLLYLALLAEYLDLYRELDATVDQMMVTHHLNTLVSSSLSLEEVCRQLSGEIRKLVVYDRLAVNLLQQDQNFLKVYSEESALSAPAVPEGFSTKENTATGWAIDHKEPLICADLAEEPRFAVTRRRYKDLGLRSFIILPLVAHGEVLGALNLGSLRARQYDWKDLDTLAPVAEILSIAVENAKLYEQSQRHAEIQRLLKEVTQDITSLDVDHLLEKLTQKVCAALRADVSDVRIMVEGTWKSLGVSGIEPDRLQSAVTGSGLRRSRVVMESRQPLTIDDMSLETPARRGNRSASLGFRGFAAIPLFKRDGEVIGVLRVLTYRPRHFTREEIDLLQQLAGGAAIAIENARLFETVREKSKDLESINLRLDRLLTEQSAMREIFSQINLLDVGDLLRQLTEHALVLLRADHVRVSLVDDGNTLRTVAALGKAGERYQGLGQPLGRGRSSWVVANRKPLAVKDLTQDSSFGGGRLVNDMGMRGYLGMPLVSRQQKSIGILTATTLKEREFSQEEIAVAQQFAAGAAIAIENAYLLEQARQKTRNLEALIKVNSDVASLLNRDLLLPSIANEARRFLGVDGASFQLIEGETVVRAGYAGAEDLRALAPALPLGESITGKIIRENRVIAVKNVSEDAAIVEPHRRLLCESGYRSFLGVPLRLGRRVLGTINLYSKQEREFRPDEIQMITALADQTAIALENGRLFEELQKKSGELEDAFRTKTDFLNTMAHELRTPLNVVIGTQQLLSDGSYGGLTEEQGKALERIGRYAQDLVTLIDEILDLVRLDAKKVPVRASEFSVQEVTDDLELSFAPLAQKKGIELKFDIGAGIPTLKSDRAKIREIFQNLLANAVKYTENGKVELCVALQSRGNAPSSRVTWAVRDTGIGIDGAELARVFEPFYMADGVDRRKYPGTGLGLSIVKALVELLDGEIKIESELGKGTTFTVSLPTGQAA